MNKLLGAALAVALAFTFGLTSTGAAYAAPSIAEAASGTAGSASDDKVGALACTTQSYSKPAGSFAYPPGADYLTTGTSCGNIRLRPNTNRYVRVCFLPDSGGVTCQGSYTLATGGAWNTIATSVLNSTDFWFDFRSDALSNGSWSA